MDQVEVASSHLTLVNAALGCHYRVRSGPDGADLALLDILRHENVAQRFTHVAIGSGDHRFAEDATRLAALGVWVTVASRKRSLSQRLAVAACESSSSSPAAELNGSRLSHCADDAAAGPGDQDAGQHLPRLGVPGWARGRPRCRCWR